MIVCLFWCSCKLHPVILPIERFIETDNIHYQNINLKGMQYRHIHISLQWLIDKKLGQK